MSSSLSQRLNTSHHFIISNLFVTVGVTDVKLVVITGTEEFGDIFIVTSISNGLFQVSHDEGKQKVQVVSAQEFIESLLTNSIIAAIELEDRFGTRISVF